MIKPIRAWVDSDGGVHHAKEDACKAEFRKLILAKLETIKDPQGHFIHINTLVDSLPELGKIIDEAMREDTRAQLNHDA